MILDHVAILTTEIERFRALNGLVSEQPIEVFSDTGSREQYIDGESVGGRLLVMQAHGPGAYQRALEKRGPGLHHVGVATSDLAGALEQWSARGWRVHPESARVMLPESGAFLFQKGVPMLVELFVGRTDLAAPAVTVALKAPAGVLPEVAGISVGEGEVVYQGRVLKMV